MGFNTTIFVLNDGWNAIQSDAFAFTRGITEHMNDGGSFGVGYHANSVQVMRTDHADVFRLYASHGNLMLDLNHRNPDLLELYDRDEHGRKVVEGYIERAESQLAALREVLELRR